MVGTMLVLVSFLHMPSSAVVGGLGHLGCCVYPNRVEFRLFSYL
jgi:hypothetical protein